MAKKISKHSRAARRGLIDTEGNGEAKSLESLPRENSGVKKSIIRTTIKNENLLLKKLEKSKVNKNNNKKKTSALKHKLERSDRLSGVLETKIEKSISRAKYVQNARKSGWDKINLTITLDTTKIVKKNQVEDDDMQAEIEVEEEEEVVENTEVFEIKDNNKFRALQVEDDDDNEE